MIKDQNILVNTFVCFIKSTGGAIALITIRVLMGALQGPVCLDRTNIFTSTFHIQRSYRWNNNSSYVYIVQHE